jgi:hypothetical protein
LLDTTLGCPDGCRFHQGEILASALLFPDI